VRAFSFLFRRCRLRSARTALRVAVLAAWAALPPVDAMAQWPGEVEGRVIDATSRRPIGGAAVSLGPPASPSLTGTTDGSGRFLFRGVDGGVHLVVVRHSGFAPGRREVRVSPGRRASVTVALRAVPLEMPGIDVRVSSLPPGAERIEPSAGATGSVGDLLRSAAGVVVRQRGGTGRQTVSVRGSGADEVLVLVDGVPLNDPVTGEADLSLLSAGSVAEIVVLPGARSATHGSRAQGGVIVIETREPGDGARFGLGGGSLGRVGGRLEAGGALDHDVEWAAAAVRERVEGSFDHARPAEVGGGVARRRNADVSRATLSASLDAAVGTGRLRIRARGEGVRRGLPGRSYSPSPRARQDDRRGQLAVAWEGAVGVSRLELGVHGAYRSDRVRDPEPPAGLPYDERTRAWSSGFRGRLAHPLGEASLRGAVDLRLQRVRGGRLGEEAPGTTVDAGMSVGVEDGFDLAGLPFTAGVTARVDRDGQRGEGVFSHEVLASTSPWTGISLHASHRSAFSPPTLADQYFRSGVGVESNPALRGERVPSEIEVGASVAGRTGPVRWAGALNAYRGDVRDMILWAPDFRFVWSPVNVDVLRRGLDVRAEAGLEVARGALTVSGGWTRARVVYDRPGDVQVRYRPRNTARLAAAWRHPSLALEVAGRYTGSRYPVPARVNELPGFWTFDLEASTRLRLDGWGVRPSLRVERLFDASGSLIFGFPDPGRTLSFGVEVATPGAARSSSPRPRTDPGGRDEPRAPTPSDRTHP
jgi:outer membrane cobalamin receptor